MSDRFAEQVASVAALNEPVRRELYRYVASHPEPVGREAVAAATGVAHHVVKFNLDRLVADGLLEAHYSRPPGRGGPGAGRPAKLYRRSAREITVSLPERHYDLAGQVMAAAITAAIGEGVPLDDALRTAAHTYGRQLAERVESYDPAPFEHVVSAVLADIGYEPRIDNGRITLTNCPFHAIAQNHTAITCGINLDLIDGLLDAVGPGPLRARLDPDPSRCCVVLAEREGGS